MARTNTPPAASPASPASPAGALIAARGAARALAALRRSSEPPLAPVERASPAASPASCPPCLATGEVTAAAAIAADDAEAAGADAGDVIAAADVAEAAGVEADEAVNAAGADAAGADVVVAAGCAEAERDAAMPEAVTPRAIADAGRTQADADKVVAAAGCAPAEQRDAPRVGAAVPEAVTLNASFASHTRCRTLLPARESAKGTIVWQIEGVDESTLRDWPFNVSLESAAFSVAGISWRVHAYLNGVIDPEARTGWDKGAVVAFVGIETPGVCAEASYSIAVAEGSPKGPDDKIKFGIAPDGGHLKGCSRRRGGSSRSWRHAALVRSGAIDDGVLTIQAEIVDQVIHAVAPLESLPTTLVDTPETAAQSKALCAPKGCAEACPAQPAATTGAVAEGDDPVECVPPRKRARAHAHSRHTCAL